MKVCVLDCCVAVKLWVNERETPAMLDWLQRAVALPSTERLQCQVPEFFFAEVANVLWKKATRTHELPREHVLPAVRDLEQLEIFLSNPVRPLIARSTELALQYVDLAVYDACYLALAEFYVCPLVTDDARLLHLLAGSAHARYLLPLDAFLRTL